MERGLPLVVVVACALVACGDAPVPAGVAPCSHDDFEPAAAWTPVADLTFDARGLSAEVSTSATGGKV